MRTILLFISVAIIFLPPRMLRSQETDHSSDSVRTNSGNLYYALGYAGAYYAVSMFVLSKTWYKDRKTVPFHFYNDNGGYLQVDKFGHIYGSYVYSYVGYHYALHSGLSKNEALWYGGTLGLVLQTPIEIMDGIHEGYGFSWGDMGANTLGSALVFGQAVLFDEQIVKYKFSYSASDYAGRANGLLGTTAMNRILKDYNGQTYWLSMPLKTVINNAAIPPWLNIAAGYGADGMYGEFDNPAVHNGVAIPSARRFRQYVISLDVDWTNIETDSNVLKTILQGLTFVKLPFPALEYNSMGEFRWHWIFY